MQSTQTILDRKVENDEVFYLVRKRADKENEEGVWVKEAEMSDKRQITQYDELVTKDRQVNEIIGASPTSNGIWFYVQWQDDLMQGAWLPSKVLKKKYPQELIRFYENNLTVS